MAYLRYRPISRIISKLIKYQIQYLITLDELKIFGILSLSANTISDKFCNRFSQCRFPFFALSRSIELSDWYADVENNYDYKFNDGFVEGFVIECADGFMFKIKTQYYKFWKKMRMALECLAKGRTYNTAWLIDPKEINLFYFIKNKSREELEKLSIIDIRNEYMKNH